IVLIGDLGETLQGLDLLLGGEFAGIDLGLQPILLGLEADARQLLFGLLAGLLTLALLLGVFVVGLDHALQRRLVLGRHHPPVFIGEADLLLGGGDALARALLGGGRHLLEDAQLLGQLGFMGLLDGV